ncbi:SDR family NAD(P)-dependent oxidoreductase [Photobacterium sp. J15]|uniref:SDR family NAD(P)-dependent oxidoreductase n=1 Tax=Photobacterium sp. J15 TaxID=265901 RepID=UPI0007E3C89D|nr:SDR family NAD(P)-dependent oxidoreductase [Photobacterium sp. J15]
MESVLITGASSGIGEQLAMDYAADGYLVYACGQSEERLEGLKKYNPNIHPIRCNVTELDEVHKAFAELSLFPNLIILNAGTCEYIEHGQIDVDLFKRIYDVNVFGLLNCIQVLQDNFSNKTRLVIVGSTASYIPLPRAEAYGSSKAAVAYIANSLAVDLAPQGVKITLVSPGFVKTPLTDKNDFAMPMLVSTELASEKIRQGIDMGKTEIHFPLKFSLLLKVISLLPTSLQLAVVKRMTRRQR